MKKIILIVIFLLSVLNLGVVYAAETNEIIDDQEKTLGISGFIKQAQEYTEEVFEDVNIGNLYKDALSGNISTDGIVSGILKLLGSEVTKTIVSLGYILVIIIIHAIIKSISEGIGNNQIGEITYYVQYILIVTLIMTNFTETISLIKDTINNLVGFINCLLPILLALMITTGNIVTASAVQPLLLLIITFIGNFITTLLLPLILISTTLGIISKISDKIQIDKISKFFKSGVVWVLRTSSNYIC